MPYSFPHVAAMLDDWEKAKQLIDGETPDDVHVWRNMTVEKHDSNLTLGFRHSKKGVHVSIPAFSHRILNSYGFPNRSNYDSLCV